MIKRWLIVALAMPFLLVLMLIFAIVIIFERALKDVAMQKQ